MVVLLPLVFGLYYIAGGEASAFIGVTLLLVPFAREFLKKGVPTPLFYLISGFVMGLIYRNAELPLVKDIFEVSTLFLAYAASFEFVQALKRLRVSELAYGISVEFISVVLFMLLAFYILFSVPFFISFALSLIFLSISPITSMILILEAGTNEELRKKLEAEVILRDLMQVLILLGISHFGIKKIGFEGVALSLLISPVLGFFLYIGDRIKKGSYLLVPLVIVIAIILEIRFHIPSVFTVIFSAVSEQVFIRESKPQKVIEVGKMLYPFIYVYTGELIISYGFTIYLYAFLLLTIKVVSEYIAVSIRKVNVPFKHIAVRMPMAGLSLHHIIIFREVIPGYLVSIVTLALVLSEFLAPLFSLISRAVYKEV